MEPMTLGSPQQSPASTSGILPGFLLGDQVNPRSNTLSPTKKTLTFANSPTNSFHHHLYASPVQESSTPLNRSAFGVQTPHGTQQQQQQQQQQSKLFKYHPTSHDASINVPPTVGLFDSLREERNTTPSKNVLQNTNTGNIHASQPFQQANDSYVNNSGFNYSRVMSPIQNMSGNDAGARANKDMFRNFWVTVFGFPATSLSTVLSHFAQCGTIIDKAFPAENGNWIHLRFSSRIECDRALNYNGKIIASSLMVGVMPCTDPAIINDENNKEDREPPAKIRSLSRVAYETTQSPTTVEPNVYAPKLSSGIVSKAMDLFFGW